MASTHIASMNANMPISPRICETLDPCVVLMKEMMQEYTHLWQEKGGIFSLAQGVVYWNPPEASQQALIEEIRNPTNTLHTYGPSQGIPELTSALQTKISQENGLNNHSIMVTTGANQAYVNCVLTCLCDSSKAVVFKPYYFNHVMALQMSCGNDSVVVGPCSDEGIPDLDWLEQTLQAQKVDMVTIVNPGNPTGVSLSKDYLQKVVDLCAKHSVWLVLDCTYEYFTIPEHQPIATFPAAPHVIHIFSFSKSYSLAGYRCEYLVMHNESKELWKNMQKVQDTIPIGPARVSQVAALGALQQTDSEWVRNRYHTLDSGREAILSALEPLPRTMGGTGAMYLMGKLPPMSNGQVPDDVEFCRTLVEKYGIAVIPGSFCGFPGWIRVCYANLSPETCQEAANRLEVGIRGILQMPKT
eukprot:Nitzschia sp. Nitz4//scaffold41_size133979//110618//111859//NITZ4_003368-RA/size133979-processed-gene-0.226-mRNA-1//1//CDS//3329551533//7292//frame0